MRSESSLTDYILAGYNPCSWGGARRTAGIQSASKNEVRLRRRCPTDRLPCQGQEIHSCTSVRH